MTDYKMPVGGVGSGSQPSEEDGAELAFMSMPSEMATYSMPDISAPISAMRQANESLKQIQESLNSYQVGEAIGVVDLSALDKENRKLVDEVLGEGEVSIVFDSEVQVRIQESVLAGVWRVQYLNAAAEVEKDTVEIGDVPLLIRDKTFTGAGIAQVIDKLDCPDGVNNAIPLLTELNDKIKTTTESSEAHAINLTLLPQSDEDLEFLAERLGKGPVTILSRGYGNCRVTSTTTKNVWWVQYFNSQDAIILNTLEVTPVPIVVCASQEDIEDSAERLEEIRQVYA